MKKILVIQTAFPGDAILTLPLIQYLSEINPNSVIDVVAIPATAEIFEASPFVNKAYPFDKKSVHKSIYAVIKFALSLRKEGYDYIYSPHRSARSSLIVLFSGAENSIGFDTASLKFVYGKLVHYDKNIHEVHRNLCLAGFPKNGDWKILPVFTYPQSLKNRMENYLTGLNEKIAVIAPGSVWATKRYPERYFAEIIKLFAEKNFTPVLIGSKDDEELCAETAKLSGRRAENFAGKLSLLESAYLMTKSKIIICNDSAPTHMAAAAGTPALTIYCSTIPEFGFYPYSRNSDYISLDNLECKPCGIHGRKKCPVGTFACGENLNPSDVFNKALELLS